MPPEEQPTTPIAKPEGPRASASGQWQAPSVGQMQAVLPQYEVLEMLGRGGMGAVYKARQRSLKRLVAIKVLPLEAADDELKFAERFQNEAQTMAQMNHPAIVSVHDFGETSDGLLYFVMEFVDGTDVHKMIQSSGRLSGEYALKITAHVCDALSYAHKRGVIHRDIKPANILIDSEGHIKVADFGLAKMNDPSITSGLTRTNMAMGTPDYVAPEVLVTGMVADHRADLYAVGVMLYQMLTGEVPRGMFKLPSQKGIGSDPRFDEIICRAMEQDREERYQSAMDVRCDLDVILTTPQAKNDGTGVVPAKEFPRSAVTTSSLPSVQQDARTQKLVVTAKAKELPKKKSPAAMWITVGGIVAMLGVGGVLLMGGKFNPPSSADTSDNSQSATTAEPNVVGFEKWTDRLIDTKWSGSWLLKDGVLTPLDRLAYQDLTEGRDVALRVKARRAADAPAGQTMVQPSLRQGPVKNNPQRRGSYQFQGYVPGGSCSLVYLEEDLGTRANPSEPDYLLRDQKLPDELRGRAEIEWEFRAVGDELSIWADGKFVASARDSRLPSGKIRLTASPGVEILAVQTADSLTHFTADASASNAAPSTSGGGKVDAVPASAQAPPDITNWQDMTESLREKARAIPELRLDGTIVRHVGQGKTVTLPLTDRTQGDCAVRLRFVGDGQVDIHATHDGMAYVLCQRAQTIFQRQMRTDPAPVRLIPAVLHPADYDAALPHELLVTAQGPTIRAWVDGRFVGEAQDQSFTTGAAEIAFTKLTAVHKVEIADLTQNASASAPKADWQDVTPALRDSVEANPGFTIEGDLISWTGDKKNPPRIDVTPGGRNDYTIRLKHVGAGQINVRSNAQGFIYVQAAAGGLLINRWMRGDAPLVKLLTPQPIPFSYSKGEPHDLTVTVQGSIIRAWLDGQLLGTVEDTTFAEGTGAVAFVSYGKVQKVEVAELNDEAVSAKAAPPAVTNWQDVTSKLRASLATKKGFTVDSAGVHRAPGASNGDTMVMGPDDNDRAVRVRYTGQAQVSLWISEGSGSAYVLAARDRLMIKRQAQKVGEADSMVPSVFHPAGFDPSKPHELIVAVQGPLFRAWLDDRFVGEARDTALEKCSIAVVPMASSTVQKVEVAEIEDAGAKGDWQPIFMKPEDFGGDLRDVEFRDGAVFLMKRSHLAPAEPSVTAIRATLRFCASDRTGSLSLRSTEGAAYGEEDFACMAYVAPSGGMVMKVRDRTTGSPVLRRHDFPLSPALKLEESFTFELRAADGKITASINGHEVGSVPDTWKGGARRFSITPSTTEMTEFRDVGMLLKAGG